MNALRLDFSDDYYELSRLRNAPDLLKAVRACIETQKEAGVKTLESFFRPNTEALHAVSEETLLRQMQTGNLVSDIRTERSISNCIAFNSKNLDGSVLSGEVLRLRRRVDRLLAKELKALVTPSLDLQIEDSGHFWYPPGGYMGWHTNLRTPGWRLYINYCEEPGKSFFRYRHPESGEIITSRDEPWNFRMFKITGDKPFWHCVYSQTNRFSLGYKITPRPKPSIHEKWAGRIKALAGK